MNIDLLAIKVTIILLPGFISMFIWQTFSNYRPVSNRQLVAGIILFSIINYSLLDLPNLLNKLPYKFFLFKSLLSSDYNIDFMQVVYACCCSILVGVLFMLLHNNDFFHKFFSKIGFSNIGNNQNLWDSYFIDKTKRKKKKDLDDDNIPLNDYKLSIYDKKTGVTYLGEYYSANVASDLKELVLHNVEICINGKETNKCDFSYISFNDDDIIVNFVKK